MSDRELLRAARAALDCVVANTGSKAKRKDYARLVARIDAALAAPGVVVPRDQWMGCIAPLSVGDTVKVKYRDGSGYLSGVITRIWELPHPQAQVNEGWCFHAHDEVIEYKPADEKECLDCPIHGRMEGTICPRC